MTPEQIAQVASLVTGYEYRVEHGLVVAFISNHWRPDFTGSITQAAQAAMLVRWISSRLSKGISIYDSLEYAHAIALSLTNFIELIKANKIEDLHELAARLGGVE